MNEIETWPIKDLILNKNTPKRNNRVEHFFIPSYQRGYRWEEIHVEALLDDIHNFIESNEENYCLQPIVVAPHLDEDGLNRWEVIDGQQRLITLYIIFNHINKPKYSIQFEKRGKSNEFLKNLKKDTYDYTHPDFAFMSKAHNIIDRWFTEKTENDISYIDNFYSKLTRNVQVIWYKTAVQLDAEKIDIFNRLNIGKIPLTDAELIRALLLSKIKYGLNEREANLRQAELSNEWTQIEYNLRNEELWLFLNNGKEQFSSHIEFIFNIIASDLLVNKNTKMYSTYLCFEQYIKSENNENEREKAEELWSKTKEIFAKFNYWYKERTLYHHIGFLLINNTTIKYILKSSSQKKSEFKKWLITKVKEKVRGVSLEGIDYQNNNTKTLLLLFNILSMEQLVDNSFNRFPFNHYKQIENKGGWSIEHIHAQNSEELKEEKAIRGWINETLSVLRNIPSIEKEIIQTNEDMDSDKSTEIKDLTPYIESLEALLEDENIDINHFNITKNEIISVFDSSSVHDLDNLALLGKKDNSALNNSIFPVKRKKIIEIEKQGDYIPLCTRNVFLKVYNNSDNQPFYWSKADKKAYFQSIKEILEPYLN